jgi:hypothetical protein
MFEYEPLKATGILMVVTVVSAMWVVRDRMALALRQQPQVKEKLMLRYMKLRGIAPYDGRHRLA